jgi:hypothetical protein
MKKFILPSLFIIGVLSIYAQTDKTTLLENLEANQFTAQKNTLTATVKTSTRLFKLKDDLTTVIQIIPSGSVVSVIGSDSTYFHIVFEENEGYILKKHAIVDKAPTTFRELETARDEKAQENTDSRFTMLEGKYGETMAARIYAGKIWKGMNSDMVKDSWGTPAKINRVINGNVIREEWIYRSTWLYFENNTLVDWGPAQK